MSKGERTRQMIIEKAAPLINKKGMAGTSISEIMKVTGLKKGGIYRNFESKEEICLEVFDFLWSKMLSGILDVVKHENTGKGKLVALYDHHLNKLVFDEGGCALTNFGTEADDTNSGIKALVASKIVILQKMISSCISSAIEEGDFKGSLNPEKTASGILSKLLGAMLTSRIMADTRQMKYVVEQLKKDLEDMAK